MKKIFLLPIALMSLMYGCTDVNDKFDDWLPDATKKKNVLNVEHTITDADIAAIASATKGTENAAYATKLSANMIFSDEAPASILIPYLMATKYFTADVGSIALINYKYKNQRDEVVAGLSTSVANPAFVLGNDQYKEVWGTPFATALTPAKSPAVQLPKLLATKFPAAEAGSYKVIEYAYSQAEPVPTLIEGEVVFNEDFQANPAGTGSGKPVDIAGWINKDVTGGTIFWQCRTLASTGNNYTQVSSFQSGAKNDVWLITPQIDVKATIASPKFSFDIAVGNYNKTCLKIFMSENFDGNQANILAANWTDITSNFTIPTKIDGLTYTPWANAGRMDLAAYKGKKVYFAFRYEGDDSSAVTTDKATTTYQLDNIKVADAVLGLEVASKETQYAAYQFNAGVWKAVASSVIVLQPADYALLGTQYITTDKAETLIPAILPKIVDVPIKGMERVVVYKTNATTFYADRVTYSGVEWKLNDPVEMKADQFILSTVGWVFDPTFVINPMASDDYKLVVNYVAQNMAVEVPGLINRFGDAEFYYGFNANYKNITFRASDRLNDPTYPASGTDAEKLAFCKKRTIEGMNLFLGMKFPDATPQVNGVDQKVKITATLYYGPAQSNVETFVYEFQCVGNKEWKYLQRTSALTGVVEKAE